MSSATLGSCGSRSASSHDTTPSSAGPVVVGRGGGLGQAGDQLPQLLDPPGQAGQAGHVAAQRFQVAGQPAHRRRGRAVLPRVRLGTLDWWGRSLQAHPFSIGAGIGVGAVLVVGVPAGHPLGVVVLGLPALRLHGSVRDQHGDRGPGVGDRHVRRAMTIGAGGVVSRCSCPRRPCGGVPVVSARSSPAWSRCRASVRVDA